MTTQIDTSILCQIATVQAARRKNWLPGYPVRKELEESHLAELKKLRSQLDEDRIKTEIDTNVKAMASADTKL